MTSRVLLGLLLLSIASIASAGMKNEPDGFRGLKWGTELSTISEQMTLDEKGDRTSFYNRKDDKLQIGGAELASLAYGFTDGRLHHVFIKTSGIANKLAIIEAFRAQFGNGYRPNRYMDRYYWDGPITKIIVSCNSVRDDCNVILSSTEMDNQEKVRKQQAAEGAKNDF